MAHAVNESRPGSLESTEFGFTEDDEFVGPDVDTHNKRRTRRVSTDTKWGTVLPGSSDRLHDNYVLHDVGGTRRRMPEGSATSEDDDLARMDVLTDDLLIGTLERRLSAGRIYTYIGDILIAVNPYTDLGLYSPSHSLLYTGVIDPSAMAPHIFAVADRCYSSLTRTGVSQICVISGESGSGKTESTKLFIRQVLDVAHVGVAGRSAAAAGELKEHASASSTGGSHPIEAKILKLNPILESFGNAMTVMNDNSSRFGKLVELVFNRGGSVVGAHLAHYLLEKARLVVQGPGESNFHVFQRFFVGGDPDMLERYQLHRDCRYRILPPESLASTGSIQDEWTEVVESLKVVGITDTQQEEIMAALASVLLLGDIECRPDADGDGSEIDTSGPAERASAVLAVRVDALIYSLTKTEMTTRGETIVKAKTAQQASATRDALLKAVYERLFTWIVRKLDRLLCPTDEDASGGTASKIGILDIFGFENFDNNGFGQMCINLANERLHLFFYKNVFEAEAKAYVDEGLDLDAIGISDNAAVITLFLGRPVGIISMLDEESRFPKASEKSLLTKLETSLKKSDMFSVSSGQGVFSVTHFAGAVKYNADDFLEANRDPLPEDTVKMLEKSAILLISELFSNGFLDADYKPIGRTKSRYPGSKYFSKRGSKHSASKRGASKRGASKRGAATGKSAPAPSGGKKGQGQPATVASSFVASLDSLISLMNSSRPHFVRCIKPNMDKQANRYDPVYVRRQLNYCGMLETVRIRQQGFPHRLGFAEFFEVYRGLAFSYADDPQRHAKSKDWRHNPGAQFRGSPNNRQRDILGELLKAAEAQCARESQSQNSGGLSLAGWQIGKTKVFLKYWHLDLLNTLLVSHDRAALRLQLFFRGVRDRLKFLRMLDESRAQQLHAMEFLSAIRHSSEAILTRQQCADDEDDRRGANGLEAAEALARKESHRGNVPGTKQGNKLAAKDKKGVWKWWMKTERPRHVHTDESGVVEPWFHGQIHRDDAEALLRGQADGTFLIRVSDRAECYAMSLWYGRRVRHYRVLIEDGRYHIFGETRNHDFASLSEMIEYHSAIPISISVGDTLSAPLPVGSRGGLHRHLGLAEELQLTPQGVDPVPKVAAPPRGEAPPPGKLRRSDSSLSVTSHVVLRESENENEPLDPNQYLRAETVAGYNDLPWLHGDLNRQQAVRLIGDMAMPDGAFLVRKKKFTSARAVYVLTYCYKKRIYHHQLEWDQRTWKIEGTESGETGTLEDLIEDCMRMKHSTLWAQLTIPATKKSRPPAQAASGAPRAPSVSKIPNRLPPKPPSISRIPKKKNTPKVENDYEYQDLPSLATNGHSELPSIIRKQPQPKLPATGQDYRSDNPPGSPHIVHNAGLYEAPTPLHDSPTYRAAADSPGPFAAEGRSAFYVNKMIGKPSPEAQLVRFAKKGQRHKARELLQEQPVNVNAIRRNGSGRTALFYAAQSGFKALVELLLEHGADPNIKDSTGTSVVSAAADAGHHDVVLLLKRASFAPGGHELLAQMRSNRR